MIRITVVAVLCWPLSTMAGDWPQFLGPNRNGTAVGEEIVVPKSPAKPPILWRTKLGAGYSGPIVIGNPVIAFHQSGNDETLECFQATDGKRLWKTGYPCDYQGGYGTGPGPRGTPCSADGVVYSFGASATLQAVELETGKPIWRRELQSEFQVPEGYFGVGTSPMVEGDKLLVTVGAKKASLVGFNRDTGEIAWSATQDEASYASPTVAEVGGKRRAFFFARTGLHVIDPDNGNVEGFFRWRARMDASVNAATPILVENRVFISAEYGTGAASLRVDADKLVPVWSGLDSMSNHYNTCVVHDGYLYGIDGRQEFNASLRCTNFQTGEVAWTEEGFGCAATLLVGNRLLMWTEGGEVVWAEATPDKYQEIARLRVGRPECRAYPALSNGVLYVRTPEELVALDFRP